MHLTTRAYLSDACAYIEASVELAPSPHIEGISLQDEEGHPLLVDDDQLVQVEEAIWHALRQVSHAA